MNDQSQAMMIKGTMVVDVVKTIKGVKDKPWDEYLSEPARKLLEERILASGWYPAGPVLECIWAVYRVLGNSNPEHARVWGKINGSKVFKTVYKNICAENDTGEALQKLDFIARKSFALGFETETRKIDDRHLQIIFTTPDPRTEIIFYLIQGWTEAIIEMTGGEQGQVALVEKQWKGDPHTVLDVRWK